MSETRKKKILTLDANVLIGAVKGDERYHEKCQEILELVPDEFVLSEPSILYQEVCGTIARRMGGIEAEEFADKIDKFVPSELLFVCDRTFCLDSYSLCSEYGIYSIDALYLAVAIGSGSILVSLDDEDFVGKLKKNRHNVEAYHVSDFPFT